MNIISARVARSLSRRATKASDVVDHTILRDESGRIFDVVGNIGHGTRDTLSVDATLPLAPILGIEGARIEANVDLLRSRVTDPHTGARRWISEDKIGRASGRVKACQIVAVWGGAVSEKKKNT